MIRSVTLGIGGILDYCRSEYFLQEECRTALDTERCIITVVHVGQFGLVCVKVIKATIRRTLSKYENSIFANMNTWSM